MARMLADVIETKSNNFDLLRLLAALGVMFGHSFWLQPAEGRHEPLLAFTGLEYSGSLAVYTFFLISGMLVTASYHRQQSWWRFIVLRLARIYPALFVCVLVSAFVVYPFISPRPFWSALASHAAAHYFLVNAQPWLPTVWGMPDAFMGNAIKISVNGSLWTLNAELKCYAIVLVGGVLGFFKRPRRAFAYALLASFAFLLIWRVGSSNALFWGFRTKMLGYTLYPAMFFILGMFLYAVRSKVPVTGSPLVVLVPIYVFFPHSLLGHILLYGNLVLAILWAAGSRIFIRLVPSADLSYGVYLWAFPIQQVVAMWFPNGDNYIGLLMSMPLTLCIAAASWFLLEKPILSVVRRRVKRKSVSVADENPAAVAGAVA